MWSREASSKCWMPTLRSVSRAFLSSSCWSRVMCCFFIGGWSGGLLARRSFRLIFLRQHDGDNGFAFITWAALHFQSVDGLRARSGNDDFEEPARFPFRFGHHDGHPQNVGNHTFVIVEVPFVIDGPFNDGKDGGGTGGGTFVSAFIDRNPLVQVNQHALLQGFYPTVGKDDQRVFVLRLLRIGLHVHGSTPCLGV